MELMGVTSCEEDIDAGHGCADGVGDGAEKLVFLVFDEASAETTRLHMRRTRDLTSGVVASRSRRA